MRSKTPPAAAWKSEEGLGGAVRTSRTLSPRVMEAHRLIQVRKARDMICFVCSRIGKRQQERDKVCVYCTLITYTRCDHHCRRAPQSSCSTSSSSNRQPHSEQRQQWHLRKKEEKTLLLMLLQRLVGAVAKLGARHTADTCAQLRQLLRQQVGCGVCHRCHTLAHK